jgi:ABC-type thiamine transport system ATPase subunit
VSGKAKLVGLGLLGQIPFGDVAWQVLHTAAIAANEHEVTQRLPEGYDTVVGERGASPSGGEKQRFPIARAFLKDAPIPVLDEPAAALDARTRRLLLEALDRLMRGAPHSSSRIPSRRSGGRTASSSSSMAWPVRQQCTRS